MRRAVILCDGQNTHGHAERTLPTDPLKETLFSARVAAATSPPHRIISSGSSSSRNSARQPQQPAPADSEAANHNRMLTVSLRCNANKPQHCGQLVAIAII